MNHPLLYILAVVAVLALSFRFDFIPEKFGGAITFTPILVTTLNQQDLSIVYGSPEERILRYVAKMETNKINTKWETSDAVQRVKKGGNLDIEMVRKIFADQEILTPTQFDTALENLRTHNLIQEKSLSPTPEGISTYQAIMAQYVIDTTPPPDTHATSTGDILTP